MRARTTVVLPACRVEAGDLLIGPHLPVPLRVTWRCPYTRAGQLRLELTRGARIFVGTDEPLLVADRPAAGDPEWVERCDAALSGAAAERALLLSGPAGDAQRGLLERLDAFVVRWAARLSSLTGEDATAIAARYGLR